MVDMVSKTLGTRITAELRKREMTVADFVEQLEANYSKKNKIPGYSHVLRVCKGEVYPGPNFLPILCDALDINFEDARKMVMVDKSIKSGTAQALTNKDTELLQLENLWGNLNQNSRRELLMFAQMKAKMETSS